MLAGFGADIAVRRMETGEAGFEGVGVGEREFAFPEGEEGGEDVEGPAARNARPWYFAALTQPTCQRLNAEKR